MCALRTFLLLTVAAALTGAVLECDLDPQLKDEIQQYQPIVDKIVAAVINGPRSGALYEDLADYVDTFGARLSGTDTLERAIDNVIERQNSANLKTSVHEVMVPSWTRGEESAEMITPRRQKLNILGLGGSSNTSLEGITAPVLVIKDFDELESRKAEVPGKIVLFNAKYTTYGETGRYRNQGPNNASLLGAAAVLVRSITPFSINSPHTGQTQFTSEQLRIPAAAIPLEQANLIARFVARGHEVIVNLKMSATNNPLKPSRNVIGDIMGATKPEEYVVISGHIDSWDVGQGAMDDAGGAFLAWHSLALINALGLEPPARTLRAIMWTSEETAVTGAKAYRADREDEVRNWTVAFESDEGVFRALGIGFAGSDEAACIMQEITSLLSAVNATVLNQQSSAGSDIGEFQDLGIPIGEPYNVPNNYFWYHHSEGDWIDVLSTEDLDQNLAIFASTTYILANLSTTLPRLNLHHTSATATASPSTYIIPFTLMILALTMSDKNLNNRFPF